jgi:nitrile hydratase
VSGDHAGPASVLAARVRRLEALLEDRGLVEASELDRALEAFLSGASPANGARLVARSCWPTPTPRCPSLGCRWAARWRSSG